MSSGILSPDTTRLLLEYAQDNVAMHKLKKLNLFDIEELEENSDIISMLVEYL